MTKAAKKVDQARAAMQFVRLVARLKKDGEGGFIMENDDAYDTLHRLISAARGIARRTH